MTNSSAQVHHLVRGLIEEKVNAAAAAQAYNARTGSESHAISRGGLISSWPDQHNAQVPLEKDRYETIRVQLRNDLGREPNTNELVTLAFWPSS